MLTPINKPSGMTSHDVVNLVREITGEKRVGHAGTLDPFATGILVVGIGRESTRELGSITESEKEYVASLEFGKESSTGDPEGELVRVSDKRVERSELEEVLKRFVGEIRQTPPAHSAVRIQGVRAYQLARRGETPTMPPRFVTIFAIEVKAFEYPRTTLNITCSSGTYIRSLARDIGKALGVGAYLTSLKRTRVGNFALEDAVSLEEFRRQFSAKRKDGL